MSPLGVEASKNISAIQEDFSSRGQRVLLVAKRVLTSECLDKEWISDFRQLENHLPALVDDLVVVGLVALIDPPRHDTAETVRICRSAGIKFVMVTGEALVHETCPPL
jgi:sodium/potassium-transporting ATPase subunit alpha